MNKDPLIRFEHLEFQTPPKLWFSTILDPTEIPKVNSIWVGTPWIARKLADILNRSPRLKRIFFFVARWK